MKETPNKPHWQLDIVSDLVIDSKWAEGLEGLGGFSHIIVLFWFDRVTEKDVPLKVHPMHKEDLPVTGLFATRTPNRPNRIGLTVVKLLRREGSVLKVTGLDALEGTPVLDIKPYLRSGELVPDATEPAWAQETQRESAKSSAILQEIYRRLLRTYGPQHWWPADEPFEVMIGAILTQSTAWSNVEKAISNLKKADAMSPPALRQLSLKELAALLRPSGYYAVKARKLKALVDWLGYHNDDLSGLSAEDTDRLREELLAVYGVGEETADSILLYAISKPVFVIDAYTRRTIDRVGPYLLPSSSRAESRKTRDKPYADYQGFFVQNLQPDVAVFNEYHALLVRHGKETCRKIPLCPGCCLLDICKHGMASMG